MKKLMTAIAAVTAAFGLYAAAPTTGTSFEALTADAPFDATKDDQGGDNASFWYSTDTEIGTVKAYAGDAYTGDRPAQFAGTDQTKYLELETSAPLTRWANSDKSTAYAIEDTGLYFDQLVKFTAPSDGETTIDLAGGKIAIWLKEVEADATAEPAVVAATNLMITAGYFTAADAIEQKDYIATVDGSTLVGDWHRVTIKAIKITDAYAGFVVYIDGVAVTSEDSIGTTPQLNVLGAKYETAKSLFPSAVIEGINAQTISAVAFNGSGAIDDVSFTAVVPDFAKDEITFNLDWTPAAFTSITAGGQVLNVADGSTNLVLSGDTTSLAIAAVANGDYTVSLKAGGGATVDGMTFNFGGPASGSIVSQFNYFEVNGTTYPTFAAALAAAESGDTISLTADCPIVAEDIGEGIEVGKEITLDLAGNDLLLDEEAVLFDVKAAFTVVNSGDYDAMIGYENAVEANVFAISSKDALVTIGTEANQNKFVVIKGMLADDTAVVLYQGKFDKEINSESDQFAFADGIPEKGYTLTSDDNYWIVQKEAEPTTWTVTLKNGEAVVDTQNVADGGFATNVVLDVEGFKGWTNETYTAAFDFEKTQIEADLTLFAWIEAEEGIEPGEQQSLGGPDMDEAAAQEAASKLAIKLSDADKEAGLDEANLCVKAVAIPGGWVAEVDVKPELAPTVDEDAAIEVTSTDFGATVNNPVPGVYYGFVATDTLDGTEPFAPVGEYVRAAKGDTTLPLTAPKGEGNARFYKLNAALRDPTK